ncbi:hypothetical protein LXL04_027716 [Taraxacum kok-saghyz]
MGLQIVHEVKFAFIFVMLSVMMVSYVTLGADDKDKEECTEQLVGLATCLPYVGGNAKSPTPDCCSGLKKVLNTKQKCLCMVIKDRNDPDLGLTVNVTLALGLPEVCQAPANVTKCPELLHLAPNSKDAQIFYQYGHSISAAAPANSPTSSASANVTSGTRTKLPSGNVSGSERKLLERGVILMGVMACILSSSIVM